MLLTENYRPFIISQQQQHLQHHQHQTQPQHQRGAFVQPIPPRVTNRFSRLPEQTSSPFTSVSDTDYDLEAGLATQSLSASPVSTQSLLSQSTTVQGSLSGLDSVPAIPVLREVQQSALFDLSGDAQSFLATTDLMHPDSSWIPTGQLTPRSIARFSSHHRESSLSSLGSGGPASPYLHNTSNPHIAVVDSGTDGLPGPPCSDDFNYQLSSKVLQGQDTFYANYPNYASADAASNPAYHSAGASQNRATSDRSLLPPPDFHASQHDRSRPDSVASSVTSESPLTPSVEPDEPERRQKNDYTSVPKLDRTMTDIYRDELFNPNFTITSAPPSQVTVSPSNEVFAQRLQAANSQHLSAVHSPVSAPSRDKSPFQHGSPLAPAPSHEFPSTMQSPHVVFGSAQQLREQRKAAQDAQAMQQQMSRGSSIPTSQTISPKDAVLEYHTPEGEANFPLFPPQEAAAFSSGHLKDLSQAPQNLADSLRIDGSSYGSFDTSQLPGHIQAPQPYAFGSQRQKNGSTSVNNDSTVQSRASAHSDSSRGHSSPERPTAISADGGTYTCTYHGCTSRFETPALLQKHKREGHRQLQGLGGPRRPDSAAGGMTQAGPHKCDRVNPSTGKPCNTVFSRPYDLTRHEDTIHNERKQKVRCDLCTDEKSFSRADALTRHYRVCHPDVEFPGKYRKRGGH